MAQSKEELILRKATNLFLKKGYQKTSMKDIAKAVGIEAPGLYYYFETKEVILHSIFNRGFERYEERTVKELIGLDDAEEKIKKLISNVTRLLVSDETTPLMLDDSLLKDSFLSKDLIRFKKDKYRETFVLIRDILRELLKQKKIKNHIDPLVASFLLIGMSIWTYKWFDPKRKFTIEEVIDQMTRFFFYGFYG